MSAFPIGVMLDSFRKPWTEALDIACELGASGIQAHGGHGLLAVKTVTPAVKKEFMAQMRDHGLVVSAICGDLGKGFGNPELNPELIETSKRILDMAHKDPRRARAAACNIIPTSTGAAKAVAKVIPELEGRFSGYSLRVPTPTVSAVDFTAIVEKATTAEEVNAALKEAEKTYLKGILGTNELPLVSMDFKGDPRSSIVELEYTAVQEGIFIKSVFWYDNEWGYSNRVCDVCCMMGKAGL